MIVKTLLRIDFSDNQYRYVRVLLLFPGAQLLIEILIK